MRFVIPTNADNFLDVINYLVLKADGVLCVVRPSLVCHRDECQYSVD